LPAAVPAGGWPPVAGPFCAIASEVPAMRIVAIIITFFRVVIVHPSKLLEPPPA
jgi:hypothetical protein